ncbi:glycosyltransferase family 4 protein [Faunimonas sp. B44]|uniref:glycosyltransferase family 4 protein n=1 Tax=Faunimonas sp. B44 TaxID=3461493 RepID=UPI004044F2EE
MSGGRVIFAVPGDIAQLTGGYGYDRRLLAELRLIGLPVDHLRLPAGYPRPSQADEAEARGALANRPDGSVVLVDGLAFGAMDHIAVAEGERLALVALVHHPLALETGLGAGEQERFAASERRALAAARRVIATSRTTAELLVSGYAVPAGKIAVAPPGTDPGPRAEGGNEPPVLIAVGSLIPRKGHDVLLDALARIADLHWTCRIVGSPEADPDWAGGLVRRSERLGLSGRVAFLGVEDDPRQRMAEADLFVLPSRYEGYGMVFAEALSQGLPVIGCQAGAVPEVVPEGAGILVPVDDVDALAAAMRRLIADPVERRAHAARACSAGARLPTWTETAAIVGQVLRSMLQ